MNYIFHLGLQFAIYALAAYSLNLVVGYTGLLSLSHAAFFGVGAYTTALLTKTTMIGFPFSLLTGFLVAMVLSLLISVPSLRLKGDYFVLASLGFQLIFSNVVNNWTAVTNGALGIGAISRPSLFPVAGDSIRALLVLTWTVSVVSVVVLFRISSSPFGLTLKALREDELVAQTLGKNVVALKVQTFAISAGFAAVAGGLFASYETFIDPTSCNLNESIFMMAIVLLGGSGNLKGPVVGTSVMIAMPEALRFLNVPTAIAPNVRQILYGSLIVLLMRFRPQGIAGEYRLD